MPLKPYRGYIAICPVCGDRPDLGNDYQPIFRTYGAAHEFLQETDGDTLEEKIAQSCYGIHLRSFFCCGDLYHHRRCFVKPCGYCRSKQGGWLDELREAGVKLQVGGDRQGFWFMATWWWDIVSQKRRIERTKERAARLEA